MDSEIGPPVEYSVVEFLHELPEHRLVEKIARHPVFYELFRIPPYFRWVGIRLPLPDLVAGMEGDVDLCWGPLGRRWKANATEETKWHTQRYRAITREFVDETEWVWPPRLDFIGSFEFKTHPAHVNGRVRRKGNQATPRSSGDQQAELLCKAGFDRVTLVDLMAGEPADEPNRSSWFVGSAVVAKGASSFENEVRWRNDAPYGRVIAEWSQVSWKDAEDAGGFAIPASYQGAPLNRLLSTPEVATNRARLNASLFGIFSKFDAASVPFPAFVRHCAKCRSFYPAASPDELHCP